MGPDLKIENCINRTCPWSGEPVSRDALTRYRGLVVGFCTSGCRDRFERATAAFDNVIDEGERQC